MSERELEFIISVPVWVWKAYDEAYANGFVGSIGEWVTELLVKVLRSESK